MCLESLTGFSPGRSSTSATTSPGVPQQQPVATIMDAKELNKVVRMVKDKPQRLLYAPIKGTPRFDGLPLMQPTRTTLMAPRSVVSASSSVNQGIRRETREGR